MSSAGTRAVTEVIASNPRETDTGVKGAIDVDVEITLDDGTILDGEVTLVRAADGRPSWEPYGDTADHWVSGALLAALSAHVGDAESLRRALSEIAGSAAEASDYQA